MEPSFKFVRVRDVHVPTRANQGDAGMDFYVPNDLRLEDLSKCNIQEGIYQNLYIEPPRTMLQIVEIEFQSAKHFLHRIRIAVIECGIGRYAWTDLIKTTVAGIMFNNLVDVVFTLRPRSNESHVTDKDIVELW